MHPRLRIPWGAAVLLCVFHAQSATLLELDFDNYEPANSTVIASAAGGAAPGILVVAASGATVDPNAMTEIPSTNPNLEKGVFECPDVASGGGYLETTGTPYSQYAGVPKGFGTGTIVIVFRPDFSGKLEGAGARNRAVFFATNHGGTSKEALALGINNKALMLTFGIGAAAAPQRVLLEQPEWNPARWYFLAASWTPGEKSTIFWKEIGSTESKFAESAEPLTNSDRPVSKAVRLGNSGNTDAQKPGENPMKGKMAYFLWTDTYSNAPGTYEELYREIVKPN